jgi:hypothetical protein
VGLSKAQQRYWVLADGLAVVGRRRSAREFAARTSSRIHEVSLHFLLFSCVNVFFVWGYGREGRPKSRTEIRMSRVYV